MREPYFRINMILALLLILVFIYSAWFPELQKLGLTIPSGCEGLPKEYCRSRGLSRAFAAIMKGNLEPAVKLNAYSISIFMFFVLQLAARIGFSIWFLWKKKTRIIYGDIILSGIYTLLVFSPMVPG